MDAQVTLETLSRRIDKPRRGPATDIIPFHYPHPVTGKPIVIDYPRERAAFRDAGA